MEYAHPANTGIAMNTCPLHGPAPASYRYSGPVPASWVPVLEYVLEKYRPVHVR